MLPRHYRVITILLLAFVAPFNVAGAASGANCIFETVNGPDAQVWNEGDWSAAEAGGAVRLDAKVVTDAATRVKIACDDGLSLAIGPSTEVNLESLNQRGSNRVLQLARGILGLFTGSESPGDLDVRTPLMIASVRSTRWTIEHSATDGGAVFVRAGSVSVRPNGSTAVLLRNGDGVTVSPEGSVDAVKKWAAPRIKRVEDALGIPLD
ncbi:MAG: FecR domain-containing protein [Pseudomonadota bacterium]